MLEAQRPTLTRTNVNERRDVQQKVQGEIRTDEKYLNWTVDQKKLHRDLVSTDRRIVQ